MERSFYCENCHYKENHYNVHVMYIRMYFHIEICFL